MDGSTHPCVADYCGGGVGRNIGEALWRLRGGQARLLTAVGDDADGRYLANIAPGLLLEGCIVRGARTQSYSAILDSTGECVLGLGDMALVNHISVDLVNKHMSAIEEAPLVVIDGNIPQATMSHVLQLCHQMDKPVFFEPTDRRKAVKPLHKNLRLAFASPNRAELHAMASFFEPNMAKNQIKEIPDILELGKTVAQIVDCLLITLGSRGVIIIRRRKDKLRARWYYTERLSSVENVSGAGDCFASGFIQGMLYDYNEAVCVAIGFQAAKSALLSQTTVPHNLKIHYQNLEPQFETLV